MFDSEPFYFIYIDFPAAKRFALRNAIREPDNFQI